jgi:hypothetical protein
MQKRNLSNSGTQGNRPILIASALIAVSFFLPWFFTLTSNSIPKNEVLEEVGLMKDASDLLTSELWPPLLLVSVLFLGLAFYLPRRKFFARFIQDVKSTQPSPLIQLLILSGLSAIVYTLFFLFPFPLQRYYDLKRVSMGWIADRDWIAALTLAFAFVTLFLLYLAAYRIVRGKDSRRLWILVLITPVVLGLIHFFMFPISSTDLYDYVSRGRISGVHAGNPFVEVPDDYPDDAYVQLAAWRKDPSAYGPLWEVLSGLIGRYSGGPLWNDILAYKGIALMSYLCSTLFIASILRRVFPHRSLAGTLLFAWNPLVLFEGVANAHNDMLMVALLLGGIWILSYGIKTPSSKGTDNDPFGNSLHNLLAFLFLSLAVLVKFIPILLLPAFLLYMQPREDGRGWRWKNIPLFLLPVGLLFFSYYRVFWEWNEMTSNLLQRTEMFRMSLASVTRLILQQFIQEAWAERISSVLFLGLFTIAYILILVQMASTLGVFSKWIPHFRKRIIKTLQKRLSWILFPQDSSGKWFSWDLLLSTCFYILLLYLLLGSLWFWPWYLIWVLAFLPLIENQRMVHILIVVSCAGQLSYILWNFVWYWMGIEWETLHVIETLVLALLILPALALFFLSTQRKQLERT